MILISMMAMALSAAEAAPVVDRARDVTTPRSGRELYICAKDEASRRAFKREHGEVIFVSAREAIDSRTDGATWSAPRCITQKEYNRLEKLIGK